MQHIHSDKIERWLGTEAHRISEAMRLWPSNGPPIAVAGMPGHGRVYAVGGGEFIGRLDGGGFMSLAEHQFDHMTWTLKRIFRRIGRRRGQLDAGFASLDDIISEATTGAKRREYMFLKAGTIGVVNGTNSLWFAAGQPAIGATPSAAPGGNAPDNTTTGAFPFGNPTGGDTQHFMTAFANASVNAQTLLLYDRIFHVDKTMSSTATEAVTGVPTRYQNTVAGTADSAEGNFLFPEVRVALGATAHNWTVCQYTDQSGNTGANLPSLTGNSAAIVNRYDGPAGQFFAPFATGDTGVQKLTQMQCSASVTGNLSFVIGHPLSFWPLPLANLMSPQDGLSSPFNLSRIFNDACLAFLEITKSAITATNFTGHFLTVAG